MESPSDPRGSRMDGTGTVNLLGGTVTTNKLVKGVGTGTATVNFNGGVVRASGDNTTFISGLDGAYIYSGGATLDTDGHT